MTDKVKKWPFAVYVEASILNKLPINIMNAEMESLLEISKKTGTSMIIPEISFQEWMPKRLEIIRKHIGRAESALYDLSSLFDYVKIKEWEKDKDAIIEDTENFTKRLLDDVGISVIDTPEIDLGSLIHMSINKIRPFEEGNEKGFRDSINLFTIIEFAKNHQNGSHILLAEDKVYQHKDIQSLAEKNGIDLIITTTLAEAIDSLEFFIKDIEKRTIEISKLTLKIFLLEKQDKIHEFIKLNGVFTSSFLNSEYQFGFSPNILGIEDSRVVGVESATKGTLPSGKNNGEVKISFNAKVEFDVRISVYEPESRPKPKYRHGEVRSGGLLEHLAGFPQTESYVPKKPVRTVTKNVPIEGSAILTRTSSPFREEYTDLKLYKINLHMD